MTPFLFTAPDWANRIYRTLLFLPEQASTRARMIDSLHYLEITVMVGIAGIVTLVVIWFSWRFRRRSESEVGRRVEAPLRLELTTYAALLGFFLLLWWIGFGQYLDMHRTRTDATQVYVTGKQWMWKFSYPSGRGSVGRLFVPAGRPVQLLLTSRDVIHSFFVPAFRIKRDAVPGQYTTIWFEAPEPGRHRILCAEMCGTGHPDMLGEVVVLPLAEWERWLRAERTAGDGAAGPGAGPDLVQRGREAAARYGCFQCHSVDGSRLIGPTWKGAYGARVRLQGGETVRVDEAYITESMMDPAAKIVAGFPPAMPSFQGRIPPADTAAIIELIKSLRGEPGATEEPRSHER